MNHNHLSSSQLNLYLRCPLKYKFYYIDEIERPFKPAGLVFGSVMHSTLEWFHKERLKGREVTLEKLYKIFETDWYAQKVEAEIRFKEGEEELKLLLLGKEMLALYLHSPLKRIKGAEIPFHIPLLNPKTKEELAISLEGIIDLIEEGDVIVEFKTSNRSLDPQSLDDYLQLTSYAYAYQILFQRKAKSLKVINFVKTRTPKMVILETKREEKDFERLFYLAREVLKGIASSLFYPRAGYWCRDCEYGSYCEKWQGN
jgi:putative RecB family exonuclease